MRTPATIAALLLLSSACAKPWTKPDTDEKVWFAASEALIVADAWLSADLRRRGGHEDNPAIVAVFGPKPSRGQFLLIGTCAATVNAIAWYRLPNPWRRVLSASVVTAEGYFVARNISIGLEFRLP